MNQPVVICVCISVCLLVFVADVVREVVITGSGGSSCLLRRWAVINLSAQFYPRAKFACTSKSLQTDTKSKTSMKIPVSNVFTPAVFLTDCKFQIVHTYRFCFRVHFAHASGLKRSTLYYYEVCASRNCFYFQIP